jgi:hypothetical protein
LFVYILSQYIPREVLLRWLPCPPNGVALLRSSFLEEPNPGTYYIASSAEIGIPWGWGDFCKNLEIAAGTIILVKLEMRDDCICLDVVNIDKC